jgi:aldose 1-epimerase
MRSEDRISRSGDQYELSAHGYTAAIASVGSTLRALRIDGRDLIVPFDAEELRPEMRGALMAPWPNRTADGRYVFEGATHQLVRNEYDTANAVHGLVAWLEFRCIEKAADRLTLTAAIEPQPGYPWRVRLDVVFALDADGLTQEVTATNESAGAAPFGVGGHPYLVAGTASANAIDDWMLELPAGRVLAVSADRLLPTGIAGVSEYEDGRLDFREARRIGSTAVNHAFTSMRRDSDGRTRVRLTDHSGRGVEISMGEHCRWVQVYTADAPGSDGHRHGLAVEPMTCPPDALNSKRDLLVIEPGGSVTADWTIRSI